MLDQAFYDQSKFLDGGWVDGLKYEDEVLDLLQVCKFGRQPAIAGHVCPKTHMFIA